MTRSAGFLGAALLLGAAAPEDRVISITVTGDDGRAPHAGVAATVQVEVRDPASGTPLGGLTPAMWLVPDERGDGGGQGGGQCEGLAKSPGRPEGTIDVNGFDVIEATDDGKLSLVDPVLNLASANIKALTDLGAVPRMWASDPAGTLLAIAMPSTRELRLVGMVGLNIVARVPLPAEPSAVIPDGRGFRVGTVDGTLLSLGRDGTILSNQTIGDGPVSLSGDAETIVALARSGDGAFIRGGTVHRFATRERMAAMVFVPLSDAAFALSADGRALVRVSQDEPDAPQRTALQRAARAIAASPDGRRLALTAADGGAIVIVDVASGRERWTVVANDPIIAADFSDAFLYLVHARQAGATRVVFDPDDGPPGTVIVAAGSPGEREQRPGDLPIMARIPGAGMLIASHRDRAAFRLHDDTPQAPMSSLPLRAGAPAGILVRYRGLLPTAQPGRYNAQVVVPRGGRYLAMVRTEQPAVAHCSRLVVAGSPGDIAAPAAVPTIIARRLSTRANLSPGLQPLRFSISGTPAARLSGVILVGEGWQLSPADVRSDAQGYSAIIDLLPGRSFTLFVRYRDGRREGILSSTVQVRGR